MSRLSITKLVEKYLFKIKPHTVLTHFFGDLNIDHQIVSKAVITSCRPQKENSVKIKKTNNGKELDFSNNQNATNQVRKRVKKTELNLKLSLSNISSIRRAIILKEVLDKPISLR